MHYVLEHNFNATEVKIQGKKWGKTDQRKEVYETYFWLNVFHFFSNKPVSYAWMYFL